jgi:hypothetical protein
VAVDAKFVSITSCDGSLFALDLEGNVWMYVDDVNEDSTQYWVMLSMVKGAKPQ